VAVKVLHTDLLFKPQAVERFRREARSAAMISHPNVVSIHDFNDAQSAESPAYIVMEYVRGMSLHTLLRLYGPLPASRAVHLMRDICAGVGVAHRQGVVHRDLKPDNVIVASPTHEGEPETAKVVDFGIAKLRDFAAESGLTQPGAVMGTIYYMSPEQCRGEDLDPRSDVYSLGAILYEMLTNEPPFRANNLVGFISKHLTETPPPFPAHLGVPAPLAAACFKALAKNRNDRPVDALALGRELQSALAPQPAVSPGSAIPPPASRVTEPAKQNWIKWFAGAGVVLLLVGILGVAVSFYFYQAYFATTVANGSENASNQPKNQGTLAAEKEKTGSQPFSARDLKGIWTGTYGPLGKAARLLIRKQAGNSFEGILEQDQYQVTFEGTYDSSSLTVSLKQLKVLAGDSWSLGQDSGKLTADGTTMSGTGQDAIGGPFGITYQWSFKRQQSPAARQ